MFVNEQDAHRLARALAADLVRHLCLDAELVGLVCTSLADELTAANTARCEAALLMDASAVLAWAGLILPGPEAA